VKPARKTAEAIAAAIAVAAGILLLVRLNELPRVPPRRLLDNASDDQSHRAALQPIRSMLSSPVALRAPGRLLFGVHQPDGNLAQVVGMEQKLGFPFALVSFNVSWGEGAEHRFPSQANDAIEARGSVPMITWEPWVMNFQSTARNQLPPRAEREYRSLAAIGRGDYDFYIHAWAADAARYGKPILLRFAHQMNDPYRHPWGPQNGNRPEDFVAAWRYLHNLFQRANAHNVLWVWSPTISIPWFEYYFPGAEYVDWIGVEGLNHGTAETWSRWWTFHQILEKPYGTLAAMQKPIMITEFATRGAGGDPAEWYRQAFTQLEQSYTRVRALVLPTDPRWSVLENQQAAEVVAREMSRRLSN
jgi:hypothetical protein